MTILGTLLAIGIGWFVIANLAACIAHLRDPHK